MNILNRVLMILFTLLALAVVTLFAAAPAEALGVIVAVSGFLKSYADRLLPAGRLVAAAAGMMINLILLFWLWLQIRRPNYRTVRVRKTEGARAEVTVESLVDRLEYAVDSLADVLKAKAHVRSYGGNVEVRLEAEIKPGIEVAAKANEIAAAVREVTETTMGLQLRGAPRIKIRAMRFEKEAFAEPEARLALPAPASAEEAAPAAEAAPASPPVEAAVTAPAVPSPSSSRRQSKSKSK